MTGLLSSLFASGNGWFTGSAVVAVLLLGWWLGVVLMTLRARHHAPVPDEVADGEMAGRHRALSA